ncbi:MAG: hypothetical protein Q8R96_13655 [Bacteroidota bacterium]|nr:hypothetical protein [Bacteroidota bacterium]
MTTINNLREKLTGKINQIERIDLLEYMLQLIENEEDMSPYQLTAEQQNAVAEALDQYKSGQFISDEDADEEISKWINK